VTGCRVILSDQQEVLPVDPELLERVVVAAARKLGRSITVSVALVEDDVMAELHERFLGIPGPTDVLSFPLPKEPGEVGADEGSPDGEIVISTRTAVDTAARLGIDPQVEVCLYAVHGLLHLLGHDDHSDDGWQKMHELETEVLGEEMGVDPRVLEERREAP